VLVIGGSSEYLKYADTVLLMEDYEAKDKTHLVEKILHEEQENDTIVSVEKSNSWTSKKQLHTMMNQREFFYCESVQIENARYIKIDEYVADISKLTAVISEDQINSLTYMLEGLLGEKDTEKDLYERCMHQVEALFENTKTTILSFSHKYELWLENVRPIDLLMAVFRLRV
jgi:predicted ABC-class ATPase